MYQMAVLELDYISGEAVGLCKGIIYMVGGKKKKEVKQRVNT